MNDGETSMLLWTAVITGAFGVISGAVALVAPLRTLRQSREEAQRLETWRLYDEIKKERDELRKERDGYEQRVKELSEELEETRELYDDSLQQVEALEIRLRALGGKP
jgi:uncharacterized coiled-coil DUF342 family protein